MIEEEFCSPDIRPTSCRMDHTIERLKADTTYNIKLSSHNGVSDQDLENNDRRTVVKRGRTTEGGESYVFSQSSSGSEKSPLRVNIITVCDLLKNNQ